MGSYCRRPGGRESIGKMRLGLSGGVGGTQHRRVGGVRSDIKSLCYLILNNKGILTPPIHSGIFALKQALSIIQLLSIVLCASPNTSSATEHPVCLLHNLIDFQVF